MLQAHQINEIIAEAYYASARHPDIVNMRRITDLLESFRSQIKPDYPLETWYCHRLEVSEQEARVLVPILLRMRNSWLKAVLTSQIKIIKEACQESQQQGWMKWLSAYCDGIINFYGEIHGPLCEEAFGFDAEKTAEIEVYKKLNRWILESRWVDAHPILTKLSNESVLSNYQRSSLKVVSGQIELYDFPDPKTSLKTLEEAKALYPENRRLEKAFAEYDLKCNDVSMAKSKIGGMLIKYNDDFALYNLMADCYRNEKDLSRAEQFYYDGCRQNIIQPDSYCSLIKLYLEPAIFNEKKQNIPDLLSKIKRLESFPTYNNVLYNSYRDAATGYLDNSDFKESEKYYNKAIALKPSFVTAHIDKAYLKFRQEKFEDAEALLDHALSLDADCFDAVWALAYIYESMEGRQEDALAAYNKSRQLRPAWTDQVCNFIGNMYFKSGAYEKALPNFEEAINLNPGLVIYKENRADTMVQIAKKERSEGKVEESEKIIASINFQDSAETFNNIGNYYYHFEDWEKAATYFARAVEKDGSAFLYNESLGLAYEKLGRFNLAEKNLLEAIEKNKDDKDGRSFHQAGLFYFGRQYYGDAILQYKKALEREPHNIDFLSDMALAYEKKGETDEALKVYLEGEKIQNSDDLQNKIGLMYYRQGEFAKALDYFKVAARMNSKYSLYFENIASAYRQLGKSDQAVKNLEKAIEIAPEGDFAYSELGRIFFEKKQYDKAIEWCQKAIDRRPDNFQYYENLGFAYRDKKDLDTSATYFNKAIEFNSRADISYTELGWVYIDKKDYVHALENFKKALEISPHNYQYLENLGFALRDSGDSEGAIQYFLSAIEIEPTAHLSLNELGRIHYEQEDYNKAAEYFQKAIDSKPGYANYYENLAYSSYRMHDVQKAKANFEEAVRLDPENHNATNELGRICFEQKDFEGAFHFFQDAARLQPKNFQYYENMGFALKDGGKPAEAIEYLKKATDLDSTADLSLNEIGRIYFDQKDYTSAAGFFQKAIDARPDFANYHNNLAYCFRNLGDRDKAIEKFKQALQLDPNDDITINDLVVLYFEADRYEDIISLMTDAVKIKPDSPAYYTNLALAYKHTRRNKEAIDSFEQALKLDGADYDNWIDLAEGYLLTNAAEKALEAYEKAIALRPQDPVGYANKAIALMQLGNLKEAEELVNGDHLDEAMRKDFLSQTRILFPALQIDEDSKNRLIIQQIKDKV